MRSKAPPSTLQKIHIYLPLDVLEQVQAEAKRLDRTTSWLLATAWRRAASDLQQLPNPKSMKVRP